MYNNSLLDIADTYHLSTSLGFLDYVVLITAAVDQRELGTKVQTLAAAQSSWASSHGAIFDSEKSKWMIFPPLATHSACAIYFGDRLGLEPVTETKWLGVTLDSRLTFRRHCDDVIAKGKWRADFLSSLSNTKWVIPPQLFKILITATVHAATDYAVAAWLQLPVPKFFSEKLSTIDSICATKALEALKNSPYLFLRHDFDIKTPDIRLTMKIMNTIATIAAKPPSHPLYSFYEQARRTNPQAHKAPIHAFFQSPIAECFKHFLDPEQPDPTVPLPPTPRFHTLILQDKDKAMKLIKDLKASKTQIIVYSNGSRIQERNTAAAA